MTRYPDLFAALAAPFTATEVKHRPQGKAQLSYITARTAMNRLDTVMGPENWWDEYTPGDKSVLCRLTLRLPDGQLLTKCDAGGYAGMSDEGDDDKSGYSDAFKRACVKFGVGRYLYRDGVPSYGAAAPEPAPQPAPAPKAAPRANGHAPAAAANGHAAKPRTKMGAQPGASGVPAGVRTTIAIAEGQCNGPIEGGRDESARPASAHQLRTVRTIVGERGLTEEQLVRSPRFRTDFPGVNGLAGLTKAQASELIERLSKMPAVDPSSN